MTAYLITIEGLRGPEAQIWYGKPGEFVGPPLDKVTCVALPDLDIKNFEWTIDSALAYVHMNPDLQK